MDERHHGGDGLKYSTEPDEEQRPERRHQRLRPRIYVASLSDYSSSGYLHGAWIDADQEPDELRADVAQMLAASPWSAETGEPAEEWAVHDYEDFGGFAIGEHEEVAVISRVASGLTEYGEAFAAYLSWAGASEEAVRDFESHYIGSYGSAVAWAQETADDFEWQQQIDQRLGADLARYVRIDYEMFARDMATVWHIVPGSDGHVHVFAP